MAAVVLSTVEQALAFLADYSHSEEVPDVQFEGELAQIRIDISGNRYHATIPGELARGLWQFQEASVPLEGRHYIRPFGGRKTLYIWEHIEADMAMASGRPIRKPCAHRASGVGITWRKFPT